jgi:hypothetical protein
MAIAGGALAAILPAASHERSRLAETGRFLRALRLPFDERITMWSSLFFTDLPDLLRPELVRALRPIDRLHYIGTERAWMEGRSTLSRLLHANFTSYLADDLLVKADRCTMASSEQQYFRVVTEGQRNSGPVPVQERHVYSDHVPGPLIH